MGGVECTPHRIETSGCADCLLFTALWPVSARGHERRAADSSACRRCNTVTRHSQQRCDAKPPRVWTAREDIAPEMPGRGRPGTNASVGAKCRSRIQRGRHALQTRCAREDSAPQALAPRSAHHAGETDHRRRSAAAVVSAPTERNASRSIEFVEYNRLTENIVKDLFILAIEVYQINCIVDKTLGRS